MSIWLPTRKSDAALPLVCLPFAGGGTAVYHLWRLEPRIEVLPVRLPGREGRIRERALDDFQQLVDILLMELKDLWSTPFALFGHSMGAMLALELARRTTAAGQPPVCLFVSACRPPDRVGRVVHGDSAPLYELPSEAMIDGLIERYGMQVEPAERALMLVLSETLRGDLKLFDSFKPSTHDRLSCPVFACGGADDPVVTRTDLGGWRNTTDGQFAVRVFPGGHFYLRTHHQPISGFVQQKLLRLLELRP